MTRHIIYYKNTNDNIINHIIVHECGHIKRVYETSEERIVLLASNKPWRMETYRQMIQGGSLLTARFGIEAADEILSQLFDGIVRKVTNQPIDLMIEKWIYNDYPELRQIQLDSLISQNKDAFQGLDESKKLFPDIIVEASNFLNAA